MCAFEVTTNAQNKQKTSNIYNSKERHFMNKLSIHVCQNFPNSKIINQETHLIHHMVI